MQQHQGFSFTHTLEDHPWFVGLAVLGVFLVILFLFEKGRPGVIAPTAPTDAPQGIDVGTAPPPTPIVILPNPGAPPPTGTLPISSAHVRAKSSQSWDKTHNGPPFYRSLTGSSTTIPFGIAVTVVQTGLSGPDHNNGGIYAQISSPQGQGFIASQDLVS
jgi:hypothetical protein